MSFGGELDVTQWSEKLEKLAKKKKIDNFFSDDHLRYSTKNVIQNQILKGFSFDSPTWVMAGLQSCLCHSVAFDVQSVKNVRSVLIDISFSKSARFSCESWRMLLEVRIITCECKLLHYISRKSVLTIANCRFKRFGESKHFSKNFSTNRFLCFRAKLMTEI